MMRKLNIENLQAKVLFEKKPNLGDEIAPNAFEVSGMGSDRLYFTKAINPEYFSHFSKITIFLKVASQWKPYNLSQFWPEDDEKEFGKVDCLVFQFGDQKEGDKFKYDLEGARC